MYVLSVWVNQTAKHFYVWHQEHGGLQLQSGHPKFRKLLTLLNYYRSHPLSRDADACLRTPIRKDKETLQEEGGYVVMSSDQL